MSFIKILCLGFLTLGIFSCANKESDEKLEETLVFDLNRQIRLPLDSVSTSSNNYYQLVEVNSKSRLYFFNKLNYRIYCYDLDSEALLKTWLFEKEGPNGLGSRVTSFKLLTDSTIIFHSYYRRELIFSKISGDVIQRVPLQNQNLAFSPITSQNQPFIYRDEEFLVYSGRTSNREKLEDEWFILRYKTRDSSISDTGIRLPDFYQTSSNEYFPADLSEPTLTFNSNRKTSLISFPLSDSVIVLNKNGDYSMQYLGTNYHDLGDPLRKGSPKNPMEQIKDVMRFSRYGSIHFDPYRHIYLRTYMSKTSDELLDANRLVVKQKIVIADFKGTDQLLFSKNGMYQVLFDNSQEDDLIINVFEYGF